MNFYTPKLWIWQLLAFLMLGLYACMPPLPGTTQTVSGVVTDNRGKKPISDVSVTIKGNEDNYQTKSDSLGRYEIPNVIIGENKSIRAAKSGYENFDGLITVSNTKAVSFPVSMMPKRQITLSPADSIKIDANDKNKSISIKNTGTQGAIRVTITPDPAAQWLSVEPKTALLIEQGDSQNMTIVVDSKGITSLGNRSALVTLTYKAAGTSYVESEGYKVLMAVTTLPTILLPTIANIVPQSGGYNTVVTIDGQNFATDTSKVQVYFEGGKKAQITSTTPTQLKVKVPVGAKTGPIRVVTDQGSGNSNAIFTYNLTCTLTTLVKNLNTDLYLNDITTSSDGTIFVCGVKIASRQILRSGVYRINPGSSQATAMLDREPGYVYGSLNSTAKLVNPTKLVVVNNVLYIADQYDGNNYDVNYPESYVSIRPMTSSEIRTSPTPYYVKSTGTNFINDLLYIPQIGFNGIAFTDGTYKKYGFDGIVTPKQPSYQGLDLFLDYDGVDVYALNVDQANANWKLKKLLLPDLADQGTIISPRSLGIASKDAAPDNTNYPKGMVVDPINRCAYIFDRRMTGNSTSHIVYRVGLDDQKIDIIYNGFQAISQVTPGMVLPDASKGTFAKISCLTYDNSRQAVVFVDVDDFGNNIRSMECK